MVQFTEEIKMNTDLYPTKYAGTVSKLIKKDKWPGFLYGSLSSAGV